jgi:hypothetical protein
MEELRRVLREQDGKERTKGKRKGKEKKVEGEVMSPEEKAEKARVSSALCWSPNIEADLLAQSRQEGESQGGSLLPL